MAKKEIVGEDGKIYEVKEKKKGKGCLVIIAIIVILGIIGAMLGGEDTSENTASVTANSSNNETIVADAEEPTVAEELDVPIEYQNALRKAENYSNMMHMSKTGIYNQLTSSAGESFPPEAAQYAVDNVKADWKANALEKAKTYQETMAMSRDSIYEQLVSEYGESFTAEEAQYAIDNLPQ